MSRGSVAALPSTIDQEKMAATPVLGEDDLRLLDAYWRAANYCSVGQIYLLDNPLLREPLRAEHVKPRVDGPLRERLLDSTWFTPISTVSSSSATST